MPPSHQQQQSGGTKLIVAAMMLALLSVVLVNFYIIRVKNQVAEGQFEVYRLTRSVRPGDRIGKKDIEPVPVPRKFFRFTN